MARISTGDDRDEFDKLRVRPCGWKTTFSNNSAASCHPRSTSRFFGCQTGLFSTAISTVVLRNLLDVGNWPLDVIHEARVDDRPETDVGEIQEGTKAESSLRFRDVNRN